MFDLFSPKGYNANMKKKICCFLAALFLCVPLAGCNAPQYTGKTFLYFNAPVTVQIDSRNLSKARLNEIFSDAEQILADVHERTDAKNPNSVAARFNALPAGDVLELDELSEDIVMKALSYYEYTRGYFNILIAPLIDLWGFSPDKYDAEDYEFLPPTAEEIQNVLPLLEKDNVVLEDNLLKKIKNASIDFGGMAKGYALQKVREYLETQGIIYGIISGGSSSIELMKYKQNQSFVLGVKHPRGTAETPPIIEMNAQNAAASTSGDYERFYEYENERYSHLLDPFTGRPINDGTMSVTAIGKDGALCDALSTALCAMGYEKAKTFIKNYDDLTVFILYTENGQNYIYTNAPQNSFTVNDDSFRIETAE